MSEVNTAGDALERLDQSLKATNVLSPDFARHMLAWAYKAVELAHKDGRDSASGEARDLSERLDAASEEVRDLVQQLDERNAEVRQLRNHMQSDLKELPEYKRLVRDHNDMMSAAQTAFSRCACGRISESGIICPTNREGGNCEAGK